jgi:uncharacterized membrane protein YfcA
MSGSGSTLIVGMLVLGLLAGVLSGMFGIGGGLIIVPALMIVAGLAPKVATGTSLFALMWPVGLLGVVEYWKRREVAILPGIVIAIGLFIGAYFGARITGAISQVTMKRLYGAFLLVVGIYFLATARSGPGADAGPGPLAAPQPPAEPRAAAQVHLPPDLS